MATDATKSPETIPVPSKYVVWAALILAGGHAGWDGYRSVASPSQSELPGRLAVIDNRMTTLEKSVPIGLDSRVAVLEARVATMDRRLESMDRKLDRLLEFAPRQKAGLELVPSP